MMLPCWLLALSISTTHAHTFKCITQIKEVLPLTPSTPSNQYYVRLHRRCCRNLIKKSVDNDDGSSAFGHAMKESYEMKKSSTSNKKRCQEKVKHEYLKERKLDADNDRAKYCNDSSDPIQIRYVL
jgi:hypothetical protein